MRLQPARNRRTETHNTPAIFSAVIFKGVFIGPYLDMQQILADIPADNRGSTRIGMDVDFIMA
jgi:hypothetical protein